MSMDEQAPRVLLPHSAVFHKVTMQHHPESDLWTPSKGVTHEVDVYGSYSRRNGENHWATDLVQPSSDYQFFNDMTIKEMKSLINGLTYSLQWKVEHSRPKARKGQFGEGGVLPPGSLVIKKIANDIISKE